MDNDRKLIHKGGVFNARVYRMADSSGAEWIEKDFSASPWLVRNTVGRFLTLREALILRYLERKTDASPAGAVRVSGYCLREAFIRGESMRDRSDRANDAGVDPASGTLFKREFFDSLEEKVRAVHRARFVHLDLHNARNVMIAPGENPVIVDWQSALPTFLLPGPLRRALERIDLAGVAKFREMFRPMDLTDAERRFLRRSRFLRKHFWLPRLHK
ncbi:MAG: hypothetical protein IJS46_01835 [Kiritimatiellae bacterium]|nr:hypothetical protein [Kiritimatiellia bacterium]